MLIANENLFKMYDQGNKGYINAGDLRRVSQISGVELTEDEIQQMLGYNVVPGQAGFDQFV